MNTLNPKRITNAQRIIDRTLPGEYELKQIYGLRWRSITSPTTFGKMFKAAVEAGKLRRICVGTRKTNNHHTYLVGRS